jgi:hypothetical protein
MAGGLARAALALVLTLFWALATPALAQNQLSGSPEEPASSSSSSSEFDPPPDLGKGNNDGVGATGTAETEARPGTDSGAQSVPTFGGFDTSGRGERVVSFDSDVTIGTDGALTVRETIVVNVQGNVFKRGILRDFPTDYRDRMGNRTRVRFDVQTVTRDGKDEPYARESLSNGVRLRVGDADVYLEHGLHTYVITYQTNRQIGFFEGFDELYWNVTGNGWDMAIDKATATIHLPPGASVVQSAYYPGPQGAAEKNARETRTGGGTIRYETTRPLSNYEGLTVAVAFTKGIVQPPSSAEEAENFLMDNAATGAALIGLIGLALYFGYAWWKFGRDPQRGAIIPLFEPPKNFAPATTRFVQRMGYDRKAFAAALVDMAVKGYLKISEESGTYTLTRTGKSEDETGLAKGEKALAQKLFAGGSSIALKNSNHTTVQSAIGALQTKLRTEDEGVYFKTNRGWFWGGIAILALSAILTALLSDASAEMLPLLLPIGAFSVALAFLSHRAYVAWLGISGPGFRIFNIIGALFSTFFAVVLLLVVAIGLFSFPDDLLPKAAMVALVIQGILAFVFYRLLKAPTVAGQKIRDQIEGFKMFLGTAEQHRLEMLHPPHVTPEVFEKYLPYAIALDVENEWSKKFEAEAAAAGMDTSRTYSPGWYSGSSFSRLGTTGFVSAVGTAVASAAASAAVAPGSRSGSGGGGFSGGGGGGGGGGGW